MKSIHLIRRALAALTFALPLAASAQMASSNDRVRVVVSINSANQTKDIKGANADTVSVPALAAPRASAPPALLSPAWEVHQQR